MAVISIEDLKSKPSKSTDWALFDLGFRPFFLLGSLFALLAVIPWVLNVHGVEFTPTGGGLWWHGHEMIFGFALAVVFGFLLTAAQNWTNVPSASGYGLMVLVGLWLVPRILLPFAAVPWWLPMLLDMTAGVGISAVLLRMLVKVKQWRNLPLVGVVLMLIVLNGVSYMTMAYEHADWSLRIHHAALLWVAVVMNIMGGRVIAFFTERGTGVPRQTEPKWLGWSSNTLLICFAMAFMVEGNEPIWVRIVAAMTALLVSYRWSFWGWRHSGKNPLVWSLHISFLCLPISCALMALHVGFSLSLHVFTIGAMSGLILSMMSRVSLGHTGRMLKAPSGMAYAYGLLMLAALLRVLASALSSTWPVAYFPLLDSALLAWIVAWLLFVWRYALILIRPRVGR